MGGINHQKLVVHYCYTNIISYRYVVTVELVRDKHPVPAGHPHARSAIFRSFWARSRFACLASLAGKLQRLKKSGKWWLKDAEAIKIMNITEIYSNCPKLEFNLEVSKLVRLSVGIVRSNMSDWNSKRVRSLEIQLFFHWLYYGMVWKTTDAMQTSFLIWNWPSCRK